MNGVARRRPTERQSRPNESAERTQGGCQMPLRVSGKNISIGASLQQRITDRVEEAASKYFRGGYSGHATIGRDGFGFRTECVLHLDSGTLLEAQGSATDAYDSADEAATNIEKRLRRY